MQVGPQVGGVCDHPLRGGAEQVICYLFFDGALVALVLERLKIGPQQPRPERVVWPRPALSVVVFIPHRIEISRVTRWGRVERFAAAQVHAGDQDVHMYPAIRFVVLDSRQVVVLRFQPGERQRLEIRQYLTDLGSGRLLLGGP